MPICHLWIWWIITLLLPGFVISLNRDIAVQNSSHGIVLMLCLIEMDMFLMTGIHLVVG